MYSFQHCFQYFIVFKLCVCGFEHVSVVSAEAIREQWIPQESELPVTESYPMWVLGIELQFSRRELPISMPAPL